jgi:hypothetical protein
LKIPPVDAITDPGKICGMAKKKTAKRKPTKRKPAPDASQIALSVVERAIGGKLSDGIPKPSPRR